MEPLKFGNLTISDTSPAVIIAEFSDGHQGDVEHAKGLIKAAKEAGADVVKFQLHLPEVEMVSGVKMWAGDLQDILKTVWLSPEGHREVIAYCKELGIPYLCTPFCPACTDILEELGVEAYKVGSGEICNLPHQRKLAVISAKTGKPIFVSTGMSTFEEIAETVGIYKEEGAHFMLMNCTSEYPIKDYSHTRLDLIRQLRERFGVMVGQSDHTTDTLTTYLAVAQGAKVIEKHFTLDRQGEFPDDFMSLDPAMMRELVDTVRRLEKDPSILPELIAGREQDAAAALAPAEKTVTPEEADIRSWAFHSVVSDKELAAGETITLENVRPARPGWGIPAKYLDKKYSAELLGRKILQATPKNTVIKWEDLA